MSKIILSFLLLFCLSISNGQDHSYPLKINITVDKNIQPEFKSNARLLILLERDGKGEPLKHMWPPHPGFTLLAQNISNWNGKTFLRLDDLKNWDKSGDWDLSSIPQGRYTLQILWKQVGAGLGANSPGNFYSPAQTVIMDKSRKLDIKISKRIKSRKLASNPLVKDVLIQSDTLTTWWQKPMFQKATVLLPSGYFSHPDRTYPVRYNIGGYGSRDNRVNWLIKDKNFKEWWTSGKAPQIITVFLDASGPFGDNYHLNSDNNGPYGSAFIHELIPYIERTFRAKKTAQYRFVDGCSTGGWVSLALQLFYPDVFNGCWSYSPDPVDFHYTQLINIYDDDNAFYNMQGYERPSERSTLGSPKFSIRQEVVLENLQGNSGSYVTSGEQWGAWNALFSPKAEDGLPALLFDPVSGKINKEVAAQWKKYDLLNYLKEHWIVLGPKLQGKIYIWMGDMDNYYLNNATHSLSRFLKQTGDPASDAVIEFTPQKGHCALYSHRQVLEKIAARLAKTSEQ